MRTTSETSEVNVKCPNIRIIRVPEEEDKKKGHEKILEEIIVENFPKMGKEIITQVQETQRATRCEAEMDSSAADVTLASVGSISGKMQESGLSEITL